MKRNISQGALFSILLMMIFPGRVQSQADYPNKPIQILVGQPPGAARTC